MTEALRLQRLEMRKFAGEIAEMGGLCEHLIMESVTALTRIDSQRARNVISGDRKVDDMQRRVENLAVKLIAEERPSGKALRELIAGLRIASDLERVGDLAKNNAKRVLALEGSTHPPSVALGVEHMSDIALEQMKSVLDAFTNQDLTAALDVRSRDHEVDAIYTSLFRELLAYMRDHPQNITVCTHLLFCAKNIERIGDHATNIAESIHYVITGEQNLETRVKADATNLMSTDALSGEAQE